MAAKTVGRYRLDRVLGTGSFATVWLAHDDTLERRVAIKILADNWSRDPDVHRRFLSEARVLLDAESPRITRGYELGETDDGAPYLVMTWADRGTLAERMTERHRGGEPFAAHEAAAIGREIALALADVHALGHLHRDVKPSNVLLRTSPGEAPIAGLAPDEQVLLGDFGLARGIDASAITLVAGSPGYVAPEQAGGRVQLDVRADLYALGPILLELLTGDPGGRATTMAMASSERLDVRDALAEHGVAAPVAFVTLLESLTAFSRDDRPASATVVAATLQQFASPAEIDIAPAPRRVRRAHRRRVVVAAGAVSTLALAGGAVLLTRDPDRTDGATSTTSTTLTTVPVAELALPPGAVRVESASDEQRTVANVELPVDDVVAFYLDPPAPWRVTDGPSTVDDEVTLTLAAGATTATVTVRPTAETAGAGISRIVIDLDRG